MTVVRAVSEAEKTEGKPLPGHPPEGGESRRDTTEQEGQKQAGRTTNLL